MLKKINLKINGIHCKSCKTLIETEIDVLEGVNKISVDHASGRAEIEFDDEKVSQEKIFKEIKRLNYEPVIDDKSPQHLPTGQADPFTKGENSTKSFLFGLLIPVIVFLIAGGYFLLNSFGGFELLGKLNEGNVGYGLIFIIGLLAGFHCMGMCGGLVVAYCAPGLKTDRGRKNNPPAPLPNGGQFAPHLQYNIGRLVSYTVIGAILGGIGSFFAISPSFTGTVILIAGVFMILMGLSFIKDWVILDKIKLRTPQFIAKFLYNQKHSEKRKIPFVIGLLNGFMPCGPLQAMQLYALTSGSSFRGGMSMAVYALGTIPLMFGFGAAISTIGKRHMKKIFKFSGALIIILGLFMANRGLANFGYGIRINPAPAENNQNISPKKDIQVVNMDLTYLGYKPNVLYIKAGIPVRWVINVKEMSGCTNAIMIESLGIKKDLKYGENIIEFTPPDNVKEIKFSCWMRMVWGKFVITEGEDGASLGTKEASAAGNNNAILPNGSCGPNPESGGCGCGCGGGGNNNNSNGAAAGSCH